MLCEFCSREFVSRPQVKAPRACNNKRCQSERQKTNEKDWRNRNLGFYDRKYHAVQRALRLAAIKKILTEILKCLGTGRRMYGYPDVGPEFCKFLCKIFHSAGSRVVNKLWTS
jgi:hypothetical protein